MKCKVHKEPKGRVWKYFQIEDRVYCVHYRHGKVYYTNTFRGFPQVFLEDGNIRLSKKIKEKIVEELCKHASPEIVWQWTNDTSNS